MNSERIEYLDSLRGIAAMTVVIFHCMISFLIFYSANYEAEYANQFIKFITESPLKLLWNGKEAVLLFFFLSGFVLSISFLKGRANSYSIFLARRFARIYVPYIIVMALSVILSLFFYKFSHLDQMSSTFDNRWNHPVTLKALLAYIFMLNYDTANVNGVVWTLYHEMRISIIFPFIMWIVIRWKAIKSLIINACIISFAWLALYYIESETSGVSAFLARDFRDTTFYVVFFVLGATLSKYRLEITNCILETKPFTKLMIFVSSILLISARWVKDVAPILPNQTHELVVGLGLVLLFSVVLSSELAQKILMHKLLLWLGKVSFSLYLVHILVLMLLAIVLGKHAIWLTPIVSLPVSALTYKYVEEPAIKLGRKWTSVLREKSTLKTKMNKAV